MGDDNPFDRGCAWIQGNYVPIRAAQIPLLDAGFSRSDVTYDVFAVWNGTFFRLDDHLDRFERSMERLPISLEVGRDEIAHILHECVRRSGLREAYVDMIATHVKPVPVTDADRADEAFATSTAGGVMPITTIDGRQLGDGTPGPITTQLRQAYWDAHDHPRWTTPIDYSARS